MNVFTYALNALGAGRPTQISEDAREFLAQSTVRALLEKTNGAGEDFMRSDMHLRHPHPAHLAGSHECRALLRLR
ncbi:MAG: hypothetical protein QOF90_2533 [Acetobacteraceae bacterium]|nr:hypothetical protein [Acetobacteraceae bacterium]